jgi:hypothetical protein
MVRMVRYKAFVTTGRPWWWRWAIRIVGGRTWWRATRLRSRLRHPDIEVQTVLALLRVCGARDSLRACCTILRSVKDLALLEPLDVLWRFPSAYVVS